MSEVAGIVLHSILKNPDEVLELWPKLKLQYFNSSYSEIFRAISKYYDKFDKLPTFESLQLVTRDSVLYKKIKALSTLEVDDIDLTVAIEALIDQFTQEEVLNKLYGYVDKLPNYDSNESILKLSEIVMHMEEVTDHSEEVYYMNDIFIEDNSELHNRVFLNLNNNLDANTGGMALTELIMIGGYRGSGKTVAACNIATNQYEHGDSTVFFTIEMRAREINNRFISILSGVSNKKIKNQTFDYDDLKKIAEVKSGFFDDSDEVLYDFYSHKDYHKFEHDLVKSKELKKDNQIILVDNPVLTLADIDLNLQNLKSKYGEKLKTVVVDYVNQIVTHDKYDWKSQIELSKKLKDLGTKYEVLMVTPYQTDATGEARFSKGLLDSADIAMKLENNGEYISFKSTKTRSMPPFEFNAPIDWDTLKMSANDYIIEEESDSKESARDI